MQMIENSQCPNLSTLIVNVSSHHMPDRIMFFEMHFEEHKTQLTFAFWFFITIIAKIGFHRFESIKHVLPDSALLLVLGSTFGGILFVMFPEHEIYLKPDWFFHFFLPPIALEAGYFMPNTEFFKNIGTIITYAVIGTLWNTVAIGLTLYAFNNYFDCDLSPISIFLFATLISAVDPVAVICVFEKIHVNQTLYICVFGESLLNDAVTIVNLQWNDYFIGLLSFFCVSIGGILVGGLWAVLTGIVTKLSQDVDVRVVQPITCVLFPYLAYLIAEALGLSGILAIVVCGMGMKQYIMGNIPEQSLLTISYFMKTLSSSCEAVIFVFLGLSAVTAVVNHHRDFDFAFILITLAACFVYRFIGVGVLTYLVNKRRTERIGFVDQFIMGYGGIRGAVCYGLVMSLDPKTVTCRDLLSNTTIIVILFTVFVQGGSIGKLATYLNVRLAKEYKGTLFEKLNDRAFRHSMGAFECIVGRRGNYWLKVKVDRINDKYVKPVIMAKYNQTGMSIINFNQELETNEAVEYVKKHGTIAGMQMPLSDRDSYYVKSQTQSV
ncbi:Sodium hydrogen exchanger [Globodera pallida]|nr:Sodium hydrogen exchanger [Globodera pallida]